MERAGYTLSLKSGVDRSLLLLSIAFGIRTTEALASSRIADHTALETLMTT